MHTFHRAVFLGLVLCTLSLILLSRQAPETAPSLYHEFHSQLVAKDLGTEADPVGDPIGQPDVNPPQKYMRSGSEVMVACDVPLCSQMGAAIMSKGGNAADAAVTVALCIGSVNSHSSGIGGGTYITTSFGNESHTIDAREIAPESAGRDMYGNNSVLSKIGGLAVAIPGELAGLHKLHTLHGSGNLTWAELFQPVIDLNREGWKAPEIWVRALKQIHDLVLSKVGPLNENWDFIYKSENGSAKLVEIGDLIKRENYADTLEKIAKNGSADIFYDPEGPIVPKLVETANSLGGILKKSDFEKYETRVNSTVKFNFKVDDDEFELFTSGGPSSGLALVAGLNFYSELFDRTPEDRYNSTIQVHRVIEAMKWTSGTRTHLGDVNSTYWDKIHKKYTSRDWAKKLLDDGEYADNQTFSYEHYQPLYELQQKHGTSHFSVVDSTGGAVSMTTTVNLLFGSSVYDPTTGIILNDEMDDFSLPNQSNAFNLTPSELNHIRPYKRPLSSMAPTIIKKNGKIHFAIGCAGGSRIVTAVLQAIVRGIFYDMPMLEVIAFPRMHHQLIPEYVMIENFTTFDAAYDRYTPNLNIRSKLEAKLHEFEESGALTAMNGIKRNGPVWEGVSDYWRKRGRAFGY